VTAHLDLVASQAAKFFPAVVTSIIGVTGGSEGPEEDAVYLSGVGGRGERIQATVTEACEDAGNPTRQFRAAVGVVFVLKRRAIRRVNVVWAHASNP
jgi:hypothetical protein